MEDHLDFTSLLLVLFLAFILPVLLARFRKLPVVVAEILVGILIGNSVLRLVSGEEPTLRLLSEIGFAFLMFLSGLEIDFSILFVSSKTQSSSRLQNPLVTGGLSFVVALALAFVAGWGFTAAGMVRDPWMMGLILSTTSLGIVVPVLKERGLSASRFGQSVLLAALVADFATMFLITLYVTVRSQGLTLDILLIGVLFLAVVLVYRLGKSQLRQPALRKVLDDLSGATTQVKVRGAMALMMAFVVLAEFLGVELILGAFLAGAIVALLTTEEDHALRHKLDGLGFGFFIPLFFIVVGIQFDLQAFLNDRSAWILAPLLLVVAFLIKFISALILKTQYSWRQTIAAGALLSARLSLIIAASAIGLRLNAISEATNSAIILVAALTATFAPLLFNVLIPEGEARRPQPIWIYGLNNTAVQVAGLLKKHGEQVRLLGADGDQAQRLRNDGFDVQPSGPPWPFNAGNGTLPKAFIVLDSDDARNLAAGQAARQVGVPEVIALVNEPARLPEYRDMGIRPYATGLYQPVLLALLARNADIFQLLTSTEDDQDVREVSLINLPAPHVLVRNLGLPSDLLILAIRRADELLIPHGSTRLEPGDHLTLLGDKQSIEAAVLSLEKANGLD